MAKSETSILSQITAKLKQSNQEEAQRNYAATIFTLTKGLESNPPNLEEFSCFIVNTHDILIKGDSSKRCSILRAVRYCIVTKDAVKVLIDQELHWAVVASLEKDGDSAVERMQALKIMVKVQELGAELYPVAFARSLVAVANYKEDSFRKICIDTLRDLALSNPTMVAAVDGFVPLMDAVIEPITQQLADSIVITIIYLLNDPSTRAIVSSGIDLRTLVSPFTDLDSAANDLLPKWKACKSALVLLMRSWVGLVQLSADDMAWPTLIRMLKDPKVPLPTQEIILDTVLEIFEPVTSKVRQGGGRNFKQQAWFADDGKDMQLNNMLSSPSGKLLSSSGTPYGESKGRPMSDRGVALDIKVGFNRPSSASDASPPSGKYNIRTDLSYETPTKNTSSSSAGENKKSFGWGASSQSSPSASVNSANSTQSASAAATGATVQDIISPSGHHRKTFSMPNFFANNKSKSNPPVPPTTATVPQKRSSYTAGPTTPSTAATLALSQPKAQDDSALGASSGTTLPGAPQAVGGEMSVLMKIFQLRKRRGSKNHHSRSESPSAASVGSLSNSELRLAGYFNEQEALMDPIFNMMDNYTALLCCVFLHSNVIESLYFLGINGANQIALKSRKLMVTFLRTMAQIFPEDMCSDLLTIPSMLEFAASVSNSRSTRRAHKSSQILISLAEAFTVMPYKQISGNHISGLSAVGPKQRASLPPTPGASKPMIGSPSPSVAARANLPPLNIQSIFELAEEIKISSFSTISSGESTVDGTSSVVAGTNGTSTAIEVLNNLRNNLTPEIDKNDFVKQMDISRVVGKEGKEPFKWDWITICDMLEYSFCNSSRLSEALKTKWVRRVSGFYRCSVEEKGYFANLDWEPIHLQYLECACNMYSVLLKDEAGMNFLTSDRRGMLFNEMAHEIENLTVAAASTNVTAQSAALQKNVFRLYSCQCTMSREFFTLLGRIVHNTGSKHLMSGTSIFANLQKLGQYRSLDYASRLVMTSLSFTDGGVMSRQLIQQWTQKSGCTNELRAYAHCLLRILLRSGAGLEAFTWRIDAITSQLDSPRTMHTQSLYKALQEAVHDKSNLRAIIAKRPKLQDEPSVQRTLLRFLCIAEGIDFLSAPKSGERGDSDDKEENSWLGDTLEEWRTKKYLDYVDDVDMALTMAFAQCDKKIDTVSSDPALQNTQGFEPIPIQTMEFLSEVDSSGGSNYAEMSTGVSSAVKLANGDAQGGSENNWYNRDPNANLLVDLHGLVRVPWNIEVKITNASSTGAVLNGFANFANAATPPVSTTVMQQSPQGEYLRIDSFLDATYMPSPLCYETTSDPNNLIKVRGIVLDNRGFPTGHPVPYTKVVSSTILAGVCPVTRMGRALPPGEVKVQRRKSTVSEGAYEAVSRMSAIVPPSTTSLAESPLPNGSNSYDLPVSFHLDAPYDWSACKASHRQNNFTDLPEGMFSVTVPGEPVVLIFSRRSPATMQSTSTPSSSRAHRPGSLQSIPENSTRPPSGNLAKTPAASNTPVTATGGTTSGNRDASRASGVVWLIEVQYFFRLETGNSIFVPMPPHIYGELTRTLEGCEIIAKRKVVTDLLSRAHHLYNVVTQTPLTSSRHCSPADIAAAKVSLAASNRELQGVLWALGHTGSNEFGYAMILEADRKFIGWCIENVYSCPFYSLRGTFFFVLGLMSRTQQGSRKLLRYNWGCSPRSSNSAVAFPLKPSNLFRALQATPGSPTSGSPRPQTTSPGTKFPFTSIPTSPTSRNPAGASTAPTASTTGGNVLSVSTAVPLVRPNAVSPGHIGVMSPVRLNTLPVNVLSHLNVYNRASGAATKNTEYEVLHTIAKLPGVIVYRECKSRLDHIKREHPELFTQRSLYAQVHRMLESYTFKLTARREILALFTDDARIKGAN